MTVPYTTPPTAVPGFPLPAVDWNAGVRDSIETLGKPPWVAVSRVTDQLVGNASLSAVLWTAEGVDTDNLWTPGGTADRIICPANLGGVYLVTFGPIFDINATGARYSGIYKNGAAVGSPVNSGGFAGWYTQHCVVTPVQLAPGDFVQGMVYQSSGAGLNLKGSVYPMVLTAVRIRVVP